MGEIKNILLSYHSTIDVTLADLYEICKKFANDCKKDGYTCPFWKKHVGCVFRQGKISREY